MISRRLSFLAGVMFGFAIGCFWIALVNTTSSPKFDAASGLTTFPELTVIVSQPEGIDI